MVLVDFRVVESVGPTRLVVLLGVPTILKSTGYLVWVYFKLI